MRSFSLIVLIAAIALASNAYSGGPKKNIIIQQKNSNSSEKSTSDAVKGRNEAVAKAEAKKHEGGIRLMSVTVRDPNGKPVPSTLIRGDGSVHKSDSNGTIKPY